MGRKATIKDIAKLAGVSVSSVHSAMNDKPGVSEKTRERIKKIAEEMDYTPNVLASNLKRERKKLAVVFPQKDERSRFYYDYMWDAVQDYEGIAGEYKIELMRIEYRSLAASLNALDLSEIQGVITVGYPEEDYENAIRRVTESHVPVILLDCDAPNSGRVCSVQPNTENIGCLTGELLLNTIHQADGKILVCAGNAEYPNHYTISHALSEYLEVAGVKDRLLIEHFDDIGERSRERLSEILRKEKVIACCSVNSRSTLVLGEALKQSGLGGRIPCIGSGLFPESARLLQEAVITALIHKKPYEQCAQALEIMTDLLIRGGQVGQETVYVGVDAVFRSMLGQYDEISYRAK